MNSTLEKNYYDVGEISIDIVFLRGASHENLKTLHELVATIIAQQPSRQIQVWIESAEFIRLWNVPDDLLIKPFDDQVFVKDGSMLFRKQNHAHYIFDQHYRIVVVCPKQQLKEASKIIDSFREKEAVRSGIIVIPTKQSPRLLTKRVYSS